MAKNEAAGPAKFLKIKFELLSFQASHANVKTTDMKTLMQNL